MYADDSTLYCNLNDIEEEGGISLDNELNCITGFYYMTVERLQTFNFLCLNLNEHNGSEFLYGVWLTEKTL